MALPGICNGSEINFEQSGEQPQRVMSKIVASLGPIDHLSIRNVQLFLQFQTQMTF